MKSTNLYQKANPDLWKGRECDPSLGTQYWYQGVDQIDLGCDDLNNLDVAIIGYSCDEGVRRNQGRVGAVDGPDAIRKRLAKLAWHHGDKRITDVGSIICEGENLEDCQKAFAATITEILKQDTFLIALGGGHDIAYAHFCGIYEWIKQKEGTSNIGIINFDAHFDLRPPIESANSGTPFFQILNELNRGLCNISYLPIGIQTRSNTSQLFDIANSFGVEWVSLEQCESDFEKVLQGVNQFIKKLDYLYVTIDLDGFSSAYSLGVSASSPFGLTPMIVNKVLESICSSGKLIAMDVAEMNPKYDKDELSAKLAAGIIDLIVGQI